jgi:hypothetical protein
MMKKDKLKESRLNIILTEDQVKKLKILSKRYKSVLHKLCSNQKENKPFCKLYQLEKELDDDSKVELEVAIETLNDYFKFKNVGMFPVIVDLALQNIVISQIKAGNHFVIAVAQNGELYSWGDNSKGQLGLGDYDQRNVPTKINFN